MSLTIAGQLHLGQLEHTPIVLVVLDPDGPNGDVFDATAQVDHGFEAVIMCATTDPESWHALATAGPYSAEYLFMMKDGSQTDEIARGLRIDEHFENAKRVLRGRGVPCRIVAHARYRDSVFKRWSRRNLARTIVETADSVGADLILVGASRHHAPSVAALIRKQCNLPVRSTA